jgi:hypothetical protein
MLHSRRHVMESAMVTAQLGGAGSAAPKPSAARQIPFLNRMALLALSAAVAVALTLPAAASAAAPTRADRLNARSACADERGLAGQKRFRLTLRRRCEEQGGVPLVRDDQGPQVRPATRLGADAAAAARTGTGPRTCTGTGTGPRAGTGLDLPPASGDAGASGDARVPGMPGFYEMPGVRLECQIQQMEDPIGFAHEYLGPYGTGIPGYSAIDICVMMRSMP